MDMGRKWQNKERITTKKRTVVQGRKTEDGSKVRDSAKEKVGDLGDKINGKLGSGKSENRLNLGTWNVRGTAREGAFKGIIKEMGKYRIDLLALQETKQVKEDIIDMNSHIFLNSGSNRIFGTGFLVDRRLKKNIINFWPISDRLCKLRLYGKHRKLTIINAHAPTEDKDEEIKSKFYEELDEAYNSVPNYDIKIVIGDFNAKVGREESYRPAIGKYSKHEITNDNGLKLIEFANEKRMKIGGSLFRHKDIHKVTWRSPDGKNENQIDHILVEGMHRRSLQNVRSFRGAEAGSDHYLLKTQLKFSYPKNIQHVKNNRHSYNFEKLKERNIKEEYIKKIEEGLNRMHDDGDIEDLWENIESSVKMAAETLIKEKPRTKNKEWFDSDCEYWIQQQKEAKIRMLAKNTEENRKEFTKIRREVVKTCRRKKREHLEGKIRKIEENFNNKNLRNFYQEAKRENRGKQKILFSRDKAGNLVGGAQEMADTWKQHFETILNSGPERVEEMITLDLIQNDEDVPAKEELKEIIKNLKNNKSAGENGLCNELIKEGGLELEEGLHKLLIKVWKRENMPAKWSDAILIPVFKKGDITNCNNYRGIALLDVVYKILASLIKRRLDKYDYVIGDYQAGFRKGRSVNEQIFTMKQVLSRSYESNLPVHALFIDFKQAYDRIHKAEIYRGMKNLGIPQKMIRLTRMTLENTANKVSVNGQKSQPFKTNRGVRQGDPLSTVLFNIVLENVMRESNIHRQGTLFNMKHQCLAYADDLVILTRSKKELIEVTRRLETTARRKGLEINEEKSTYMVIAPEEETRNEKLVVDNCTDGKTYKFGKTENVTYLGVNLNSRIEESREINYRVNKGSASAGALTKLFRSKLVSKGAKERLYRTVIRPVTLYGCELWTLNGSEVQKLEIWERKMLRRIYGGKRVEGVWMRRTNSELYELYNSHSIISQVKSQRIRWLGHVERMPETRAAKKMLRETIVGKKEEVVQEKNG